MPYTLGQAAKATGKSKPTIQAAIKKGRISAFQDEAGRYSIDPAELHRVYPPCSKVDDRPSPEPNETEPRLTVQTEAEIRGLKERLEVMEELVKELRGDKEKAERREAEATHREAEIRRDLEQWRGFAFDAQQRLKALEAPQSHHLRGKIIEEAEGAKIRETVPPKKGFLRRLFG